jgi:dethiobiotin synthetase
VLVITGTSTGVGKTVATAAIAAVAAARGQRVAVLKPAQTGYEDDEPTDIPTVRRLLDGVEITTRELRRYPEPLAPDVAARRAGIPPVTVPEVAAAAGELDRDHDLVLVEGAGGLLVRFDDRGATIADIAWALGAPAVIVAAAGLGTLNHTALTAQTLNARGVHCVGVLIGSWPDDPGLAERCNVRDLPRDAGAPLLGALPAGSGELTGQRFLEVARRSVSPWFGGTFDAETFTGDMSPAPHK